MSEMDKNKTLNNKNKISKKKNSISKTTTAIKGFILTVLSSIVKVK